MEHNEGKPTGSCPFLKGPEVYTLLIDIGVPNRSGWKLSRLSWSITTVSVKGVLKSFLKSSQARCAILFSLGYAPKTAACVAADSLQFHRTCGSSQAWYKRKRRGQGREDLMSTRTRSSHFLISGFSPDDQGDGYAFRPVRYARSGRVSWCDGRAWRPGEPDRVEMRWTPRGTAFCPFSRR
jgi:hypothetical protein